MNRFLMLVGVAVVAAAMYVAASSASQVSTGVPVAKFNALSKKVTALEKKEKTDENNLTALAFTYVHCSLPSEIAIYRNGGSNYGYDFTADGVNSVTTALDIAPSPSQANWELTPFDAGDTTCQSLIGSAAALRHNTAREFAQAFGQKH